MRFGSLIALAGLAAFIAYCFRRNQDLQAARRQSREEIGRWEAEGGNLPAVATPAPVVATPYAPGGDPNVRH